MGEEFGPKPDMRGRDERLWGTKKDAGRSAMAAQVTSELETALDAAARQLGEDKQRTDARAAGGADPFSGWMGGRRRDEAASAALRVG